MATDDPVKLSDEKMGLYLRFIGWTYERRFKTGLYAWRSPNGKRIEPNTRIAYEFAKAGKFEDVNG